MPRPEPPLPGIATVALALALALGLVVAACGSGATPSAPPTAVSPSPSPSPTDGPRPTDPDSGVSQPPTPTDGPRPGDILPGGALLVEPKAGQVNPHPVAADGLAATVDGRRVIVTVTWTSGVEPCYPLDSVEVRRDASAFTLTVIEGSGGGDVVCIEIAVRKATRVDLGDLEPGVYTIVAEPSAGAVPVTVTVT